MISSSTFTAVLDTNVLFPVITRNALLTFADYEFFTIKFSGEILNELDRIFEREVKMPPEDRKKQIEAICTAFPDALVENYEHLITGLDLPDPDDRHVLAAAIVANADVIVTNNLKHFKGIEKHNLIAQSPDDFITDAIDLDMNKAINAFRDMVGRYINPPYSEQEIIEHMKKNGLAQTAHYLYSEL